jgi:hypothetical protein
MTSLASHSFVNMHGVIEIDEVGYVMDFNPRDRLATYKAVFYRSDERAFAFD